LVITELMPNPEPCPDEQGEWIEVLNTTDTPVDLTGLWVHDEAAGAPIVGQVVVEVGAVVLLARTLDACGIEAAATFERPLSNGGDRVALARPDGVVLDEVAFTDAPYDASWVVDGDVVCAVPGGTPGELSTCTGATPFYDLDALPAGGLVVSEWMPNPSVCDDSLGEWIELHNTTDGVVSLAGLQLGDLQAVAPLGLTLAMDPGSYVVLGRTLDACGVGADGTFAAQLANASDAITLLRGDGTPIDAVTWVGAPSGRSLSRDADGVNCEQAEPTPGADNVGCSP
ncbi:MAG: lamin tail domain-containing protein, partial [Myxococcota bacterium]